MDIIYIIFSLITVGSYIALPIKDNIFYEYEYAFSCTNNTLYLK